MKTRSLFLSFLLGCTGDPVVLANLPKHDKTDDEGIRCVDNDDCDGYCDKSACADEAGVCRLYPILCGNEQEPTCGCDGVTYFNDCLRRAAGIAAAVAGPCERGAKKCKEEGDCPDPACCSRLLGSDPNRCDKNPPGTCWVLPSTCAPSSDRWVACDPHESRCNDTCGAIRSGLPHVRATAACE